MSLRTSIRKPLAAAALGAAVIAAPVSILYAFGVTPGLAATAPCRDHGCTRHTRSRDWQSRRGPARFQHHGAEVWPRGRQHHGSQ